MPATWLAAPQIKSTAAVAATTALTAARTGKNPESCESFYAIKLNLCDPVFTT